MEIIVIGSGMMGRAIAYDLCKYSNSAKVTLSDKNQKTLQFAKKFLNNKRTDFQFLDLETVENVTKYLKKFDIAISAVPYKYNYQLAKTAIDTKTHFLDLGGNNEIVEKERSLFEKARKKGVTIIPDCGLAPGLTSVITKDIIEHIGYVDYVKLRVGGLPVDPQPPFNYQIVFSPYGLINEYVEDAIVLDHGKIVRKKSMTEIETILFPEPFGTMEAFLTSGGCSTLPYTYKDKIKHLDYKTIRYPGHCEQFKTLLDLGLAEEKPVKIKGKTVFLRDIFAEFLLKNLPSNEKDVVLLRVIAQGLKDRKKVNLEYSMIDYYDEKNNITAMMRTTSYPTSIIAQMIENDVINEHGVFCPEEIIPCKHFFKELKKRGIHINKKREFI